MLLKSLLLLLTPSLSLAFPFLFSLAPANLAPGNGYYNESCSAWGGSVIETPADPKWRFHMFNGVYTGGCGVNYWRGNSAVHHLVSNTPGGPFQFSDLALDLWHTNPQVVQDPKDGTFLLFAIGQTVNRSEWIECNCSARPACPPGPPNPSLAGVIDVHTSSSPYGPWMPLVINGSTIVMHGTNPTPYLLPNGTLLVGVNAEGTKVAVVEDWRAGPYKYSPVETLPNIPNNSYEDPFLFVYGGKFRQLVHQYNGSNPGAQFATGGYGENNDPNDVFSPWVYGGLANPAYTNNVTYMDGTVQTLHRRERPKLLFAGDGTVWLYTAVQSPLNVSRDFSWTLAQQVIGLPT